MLNVALMVFRLFIPLSILALRGALLRPRRQSAGLPRFLWRVFAGKLSKVLYGPAIMTGYGNTRRVLLGVPTLAVTYLASYSMARKTSAAQVLHRLLFNSDVFSGGLIGLPEHAWLEPTGFGFCLISYNALLPFVAGLPHDWKKPRKLTVRMPCASCCRSDPPLRASWRCWASGLRWALERVV